MKKVNIEQKTQALNEFRLSNKNKSFTYSEIREKLGEILSKNNVVITAAIKAFPYEVIGRNRLYSMPNDPIHWTFVKNAYKEQTNVQKKYNSKAKEESLKKENESEEEKALKILASKGYQIRKCVGFDLERFAKENPVLYKKYLKYEII
jgi:hypothetical protein